MGSLKKILTIFISLFILLCSPSNALSENNTSADITKEVAFNANKSITHIPEIIDLDVNTYSSFTTLTITVPQGSFGGYIYFNWYKVPDTYYISYSDTSGQQKTVNGIGGMLHETITIPEGFTTATVTATMGGMLSEIKVYSLGNPLSEIQTWSPTVNKADLMVISAHPDDDMLFMGGTIPYYAGECKKNTVVIYMTHQMRLRQTEALNGLWVAGLKTYPVFAGFPDKYSMDPNIVADSWGGKDNVIKYLVEQIRHYKPDVIVTHDANGEYGHGAHRLTADCIEQAVLAAKDDTKYLDSFKKYGSYEVKKLYLHLYSKNKITMNWRMPLSSFNGKTAFEMAEAGYSEHLSQQNLSFKVLDTGRTSCAEFGLCYSSVGDDINKNDFFENVPVVALSEESTHAPESSTSEDTLAKIQSITPINSFLDNFLPYVLGIVAVLIAALIIAVVNIIKKCTKKALKNFLVTSIIILIIGIFGITSYYTYSYLKQNKPANANDISTDTVSASPSSSASSEPSTTSTSFNDIGSSRNLSGYFMSEGKELIVNNFDTGVFIYRSNSLSITIEKKQLANKKAVYYVADIRTRNGEMPFAAMAQEGNGTARDWPYLLSRNNKAVFGVTSDFLTVQDTHLKGVLIRNGKVYSDGRGEDTLAVLPSGELKVFRKGTITATELLNMGVKNSYSFGPTLINDGVIEKGLDHHRLRSNNPRSSVGMIEPGHYICIVVDGRDPGHSVGVTLQELAEMYTSYNVKVAYAMDGGSSSGMVFMGNSVSQHNMALNWGQRRNPDLFSFGKSDSVPGVKDPVINKGNGVGVDIRVDTGTDTTTDTTGPETTN